MSRNRSAAFALAAALAFAAPALATPAPAMTAQAIDAVAGRALSAFATPGMAVGVIKDGKVVFARGYGVRRAGEAAAVDTATRFQIGSNTKAVTAAALALLVDEGRLSWDDKVIDHLPGFRLADAYVTREFTIRDLLSHRSGLGTGAGDLMFFPETDFTRAEIIRGLRYLKPVSGFRAQYAYDNLLYMVAGEVVAAVSGQSWEDFVEQRLMRPLAMSGCAAGTARLADRSDIASPHTTVDGQVEAIALQPLTVIGGAGTISCNLDGMLKWVGFQLARGAVGSGPRLIKAERFDEMWSAVTPEPLDPAIAALTGTHLKAYGLGWEVQDEFGYKRVSHTGGVPGGTTWVTMIPELNLGIVVLTNHDSGAAMEAVGNQILDAYVGAPRRDLVAILSAYRGAKAGAGAQAEAKVQAMAARAGPPPLPLSAYAGRYDDAWRGAADVRIDNGRLVLRISRTKYLEGRLTPLGGDLFVVRWNDRTLNADAYVRFSQGFSGEVEAMSLRAVSPETDFSFDFQDLDFRRAPAG
jgi:CubicO group peptidase (beta-lactamase class C family)